MSALRLCTDDILEVVYTSIHDNAPKGTKNNIFIAAFTTSYARFKLYESLDLLNQQVLYMDTDSIIYKWREGQPSIQIGDYLGQWKDELNGDIITEFVSAGAKNYAYRTRRGKAHCKVRGFTLNVRGSAVLNFNTMILGSGRMNSTVISLQNLLVQVPKTMLTEPDEEKHIAKSEDLPSMCVVPLY